MSEQSESQAASQGPVKPKFKLNLVKVVDVGCGILHQAFFRQTRNRAKALFKDLKNGKVLTLGGLNLQRKTGPEEEAGEKMEIPLRLKLDRSEFRGGINYPAFEAALQAMLMRISQHLREKKDLNILTDSKGSVMIHLPGVIRVEGQYNVLVMTVEPEDKKQRVLMRLMFVNPDQYEALRPKEKDKEQE